MPGMTLEDLKAKYAKANLKLGRHDYLQIATNTPVTFFVLLGDYSSRGGWIHPVGTHFIKGKQVVCHEVAEAGKCFICEQISALVAKGVPESQLFKFAGPKKYGMNVLVKGEETPKVFLAPRVVGEEIWRTWEQALNEENIDIFDPSASTAFTVTRTGQGRDTRYSTITAPRPAPILTGENAEARIEKILRTAANLDQRYRLPTREEQEAAWQNR